MGRIKPARPKAVLSGKWRKASACPVLPAAFDKPAKCRGHEQISLLPRRKRREKRAERPARRIAIPKAHEGSQGVIKCN